MARSHPSINFMLVVNFCRGKLIFRNIYFEEHLEEVIFNEEYPKSGNIVFPYMAKKCHTLLQLLYVQYRVGKVSVQL